MSNEDRIKRITRQYPDLPLDRIKGKIEADTMAGDILEMLEAEDEVYSLLLPDEAKFKEFIDAIWMEYNLEKIYCQGAVARILDYGRLKLIK